MAWIGLVLGSLVRGIHIHTGRRNLLQSFRLGVLLTLRGLGFSFLLTGDGEVITDTPTVPVNSMGPTVTVSNHAEDLAVEASVEVFTEASMAEVADFTAVAEADVKSEV